VPDPTLAQWAGATRVGLRAPEGAGGQTRAMPGTLMGRVLPPQQRRTLAEITDDLDLTAGDARSKLSAFWTMLALSAVIATAGVLSDSTATVIGAMIVAPLSTPIMGVALGVVLRDGRLTRRAAAFVLLGALLVVVVGALFALLVPSSYDLLGNSQISGRVSPGLFDLVAAVATGFAGAVGLTRRDVAAVLPGVAIAISLVPPLAVVGVCAGQGSFALAAGALVLFVSNFVALVLAGTLVYTAAGYAGEAVGGEELSRRKAFTTIGILVVLVLVPLVANTAGAYLVTIWTGRIQTTAEQWIADVPDARIQSVDIASNRVYVYVQAPGDLPPVADLVTALEGEIPNGIPVVVTTSVGQKIEAGTVGQ
jgi:uncharacterized hydrophobic protein (TIGR00271 family)